MRHQIFMMKSRSFNKITNKLIRYKVKLKKKRMEFENDVQCMERPHQISGVVLCSKYQKKKHIFVVQWMESNTGASSYIYEW